MNTIEFITKPFESGISALMVSKSASHAQIMLSYYVQAKRSYAEIKRILQIIKFNNIKLNLSFDNEMLFRYACYFGDVPCAKLLYEVNPNIDVRVFNDLAFCTACWQYDDDMINYITSIKPYLYGYIKETQTIIIRDDEQEQKDEKWNVKRLYMTMKTKKQPKTNIVFNLPSDISRYIMEFIFV